MNNKVKKDKALKNLTKEKIVNDFLLQFTYSIFAAMLMLYIYNGRMFKYGAGIGTAMPAIIWTLFGIFAVLGIYFIYMYKTKQRSGFKTAAVYMFISAAGMFWCIGVETFMNISRISLPFYNARRAMLVLFMVIGIATVVEFIAYFVRYAKIK